MTEQIKTATKDEVAVAKSKDIIAQPDTGIKKLTPEMIAALKKPLPPEAISQHPTKKFLSTIKTIYIVERLNDVFGIGGWYQRNTPMPEQSTDKMKVVHSFLEIPEYGIYLDNFGGNDNVDEGDAWKGAATDALSKMASYLGIGMDVYKGKSTATTTTTPSFKPKAATYTPPAQITTYEGFVQAIEKAANMAQLINLGQQINKSVLSAFDKDMLRDFYLEKQESIK